MQRRGLPILSWLERCKVARRNGEKKRMIKGFAKLSSGTVISRVTGMGREMSFAHFLGSGPIMDAYLVAFTLTNLFRRVLGERLLESVVLPVYKKLRTGKDDERASIVAKSVLMQLIGISALITAAGMVFSPLLVHLFAPGFDPQTHAIAVMMTRIMFPFLVLIGVASLFGAILLAHDKFSTYSLAPALFNVSIILILLFGIQEFGYVIAAVAVLIGGFLECVVMALFMPRDCRIFTSKVSFKDPHVKKVNKLAVPILAETLLDKIVVFVDRRLASILVSGSIASLGYAFRLIQLPYGVLALAVARTFYPKLVELSADVERFETKLNEALKFILILMVPCAGFLMVFQELLVRIIYRHGKFDDQAVAMTGIAFACYGVGIIGMGFQAVLARAFNSLLDTKTPVYVAVGLTLANVCLNYIFVQTPLKHAGLALASSIAYSLGGIALFYLMRYRLARMMNAAKSDISGILNVMPTFFRVVAASAIACPASFWVIRYAGSSPGFFTSLIFLGLGSVTGIIVYVSVLHVAGLNVKSVFVKGG